MFLLNSPPSFFTVTCVWQVPLLPKLRGDFAEFLNCSYLDSLRIFSLITCVRSRYGYLIVKLEVFLENMMFMASLIAVAFARIHLLCYSKADFPTLDT